VGRSKEELVAFLESARSAGRKVVGLGASTKGNVLLQYCGIGPSLIPAIGEVNEDKFGAFTPGSLIPIVDERQLIAERADQFLVLPWHFRKFFDGNSRYAGLKLVYPMPTLSFR
jgi:NDP-4-keto-2,6-dideoxyhexose 3-C-methyltransferase